MEDPDLVSDKSNAYRVEKENCLILRDYARRQRTTETIGVFPWVRLGGPRTSPGTPTARFLASKTPTQVALKLFPS